MFVTNTLPTSYQHASRQRESTRNAPKFSDNSGGIYPVLGPCVGRGIVGIRTKSTESAESTRTRSEETKSTRNKSTKSAKTKSAKGTRERVLGAKGTG